MDTFFNTLCSLRIKRGATAGHFDVDSETKTGSRSCQGWDEVRLWSFCFGWMTLLLPDLSIGPITAEAIAMLSVLLLHSDGKTVKE